MPKATHSVLVLFRKGMFEAYIDGLLVQSFVCADPATSPLYRVPEI